MDASNVSMYLKIDGVEGGELDPNMVAAIPIDSWSFEIANSGTFNAGQGGGSSGIGAVSDIVITKKIDKATPSIMQYCINGKNITTAKITSQRSAGDSDIDHIVVSLTKVKISHCSTAGDGTTSQGVQLKLNFAQVAIDYYPQQDDGSKGAVCQFGWDTRQNLKKTA